MTAITLKSIAKVIEEQRDAALNKSRSMPLYTLGYLDALSDLEARLGIIEGATMNDSMTIYDILYILWLEYPFTGQTWTINDVA